MESGHGPIVLFIGATLIVKLVNTDKNIFDDSYYLVSNTFPGFSAL